RSKASTRRFARGRVAVPPLDPRIGPALLGRFWTATSVGQIMTQFQSYILKKAGWFLVAFFVALILNFYLPRAIPGNPVDTIVSQMAAGGADASSMQAVYDTYIEEFGLDEPLIMQFLTYVGNVFRGDLGTSFAIYPADVRGLIADALPWSIALQLP